MRLEAFRTSEFEKISGYKPCQLVEYFRRFGDHLYPLIMWWSDRDYGDRDVPRNYSNYQTTHTVDRARKFHLLPPTCLKYYVRLVPLYIQNFNCSTSPPFLLILAHIYLLFSLSFSRIIATFNLSSSCLFSLSNLYMNQLRRVRIDFNDDIAVSL